MVAYRFLLHPEFLSETWFLYGDAKCSRMLVNSLSFWLLPLLFFFILPKVFRCCDAIQELDNYNSVHVSFSSWLIWLFWFMSIASYTMGLLWIFFGIATLSEFSDQAEIPARNMNDFIWRLASTILYSVNGYINLSGPFYGSKILLSEDSLQCFFSYLSFFTRCWNGYPQLILTCTCLCEIVWVCCLKHHWGHLHHGLCDTPFFFCFLRKEIKLHHLSPWWSIAKTLLKMMTVVLQTSTKMLPFPLFSCH
jgi:hypothetical protein